MSNLRADNFGNRVGSSSITADTLLQGTAKAWVNFNGTGTIAPRDSFNLSSLADNGIGTYTLNLTSALGNANYSGGGYVAGSTGYGVLFSIEGTYVRTTTAFQIASVYSTNNAGGTSVGDYPGISVTLHGDPV